MSTSKRQSIEQAPAEGPASDAGSSPCDPSLLWVPDILRSISKNLGLNDLACMRSVCKSASEEFKGHATIRLSQPVPPWAFEQRWAQPGSCRSLNRAQRDKLVSLVAASDVVANLEVALAAADVPPRHELLEAAAAANALASCRWLAQPGRLEMHWAGVLRAAAPHGHERACDWVLEQCPDMRPRDVAKAAAEAARGGHADLAERLLARAEAAEESHAWDESDKAQARADLVLAALAGCDLATVLKLREASSNALDLDEEQVLQGALAAVLRGRGADFAAKAEWLLEQGAEVSAEGLSDDFVRVGGWCELVAEAALPDDTTVARFEWLKAQGYAPSAETDGDALGHAAKHGNAEAVAWLLREGAQQADPDGETLTQIGGVAAAAAEAGHLGVLQALKAAGCLELRDFVHGAAAGGAMAVVEWAWEEWDWAEAGVLTPALFTSGAKSGSVDVMRWLKQRGCPMSEEAWSAAVQSGCETAVELLAELGCPMPADGQPYAEAVAPIFDARRSPWAMLPLLRSAGVPFGPPAASQELFVQCVRRGAGLDLLSWLLAQGCCVDWGAAREMARQSLLPEEAEAVLAWMDGQQEQARCGGG